MAKTKRTVKAEIKTAPKPAPKTVEIPLTLLKHLVRLSGNRQARSFLRKATGETYKTATPGPNITEPVKVVEKEAVTTPTTKKQLEKRAKVEAKAPKGVDKKFN